MKRPQVKRATVSQFFKAAAAEYAESETASTSDEKLIVFLWGPILIVLPGEKRAWY